jgi:hypothetical protein
VFSLTFPARSHLALSRLTFPPYSIPHKPPPLLKKKKLPPTQPCSWELGRVPHRSSSPGPAQDGTSRGTHSRAENAPLSVSSRHPVAGTARVGIAIVVDSARLHLILPLLLLLVTYFKNLSYPHIVPMK